MNLAPLITELRGLIQSARHAAATTVNTLQVLTNFEIGRRIVEHEQKGEKRAEYGAELLKELSVRLTEEFGKGFSKANLEYMRRFYLEWRQRDPQIAQKPSGQFATPANWAEGFCTIWAKSADAVCGIGNSCEGVAEIAFHPELVPLRPAAHHQGSRRAQFLRNRGRPGRLVVAGAETPERLLSLRTSRSQPRQGRRPPTRGRGASHRQAGGPAQGTLRPRVPRPRRKGRLFRIRPGNRHHRPARTVPARTRQGLSLRGPPEALHLRRGPLLRRSRLLQPPAALLRAHRPQARQAHPPGSRADADVCELLRPLREDCPTRTPPSASSSAKKRKTPSSNSPCPRTPTSTPGNTSSTCPPRKLLRQKLLDWVREQETGV